MAHTPNVLALILARGGSKGIPRKNIRDIAGKPLIVWTIEAALKSKKITRVVVSTDDAEIAAIARQAGADVPFMRPAEISGDTALDIDGFQHALKWLKDNEHYVPDLVVQLWSTSPYRRDGDIDHAIDLLEQDPDADSVRSVTIPQQTPFKMWRRDLGKYLTTILHKEFPQLYEVTEPHASLRQILPEVVTQTGYVSVVRRTVIEQGSMYGTNVLPFFHDPATYTELDTPRDIAHTEHVLRTHAK